MTDEEINDLYTDFLEKNKGRAITLREFLFEIVVPLIRNIKDE